MIFNSLQKSCGVVPTRVSRKMAFLRFFEELQILGYLQQKQQRKSSMDYLRKLKFLQTRSRIHLLNFC